MAASCNPQPPTPHVNYQVNNAFKERQWEVTDDSFQLGFKLILHWSLVNVVHRKRMVVCWLLVACNFRKCEHQNYEVKPV